MVGCGRGVTVIDGPEQKVAQVRVTDLQSAAGFSESEKSETGMLGLKRTNGVGVFVISHHGQVTVSHLPRD